MNNTNFKIRLNWKWFITGAVTLLSGYMTMAAFSSDFLRLTASPIAILTGFGIIAYSILKEK